MYEVSVYVTFVEYNLKGLPPYIFTYLLTYWMEESLSWVANRFSASQENPLILLLKDPIQYCTLICTRVFQGFFPQVSTSNPIYTSPPYVLHAPPISFFSIWLSE